MMFMHYYINVLDNLNAFNITFSTQYMIPVIDTRLCSTYYIPRCKQKKFTNTGLNLMEEINYKDVSLKRPSL
jgi:hypothetical protein